MSSAEETATTSSSVEESALSPGRALLRSWLNKNMRIVLTDGRVLVRGGIKMKSY